VRVPGRLRLGAQSRREPLSAQGALASLNGQGLRLNELEHYHGAVVAHVAGWGLSLSASTAARGGRLVGSQSKIHAPAVKRQAEDAWGFCCMQKSN